MTWFEMRGAGAGVNTDEYLLRHNSKRVFNSHMGIS